jgi:hypothetical protein
MALRERPLTSDADAGFAGVGRFAWDRRMNAAKSSWPRSGRTSRRSGPERTSFNLPEPLKELLGAA